MDENFRNKLLLLLKKKIENGDFNYDYGDWWYEESWGKFSIESNENIEESKISYEFESRERNSLTDYEWESYGESGESTLGTLLDFLLFRKFRNSDMEKQHQDKLNYILEDSYTIYDGMTITDEHGEDPWEEI